MRRWRRWALAAALLPALLLALAFAAIVAGVSVDASRWRATASERASTALGRPVQLHGPLRLTLGRELLLHVGDVRVHSPAGFSVTELASLGSATIALDLLDLLRGRVRVGRIEASDIVLHLERAAHGRRNWQSTAPRADAGTPPALDLGPIRLQRITVFYNDAQTGTRRDLDVESLSADTAADGALKLALRGRVDAMPVHELTLATGPLRLLNDRTAPWPFEVQLAGPIRLRAAGTADPAAGAVRADVEATAEDLQQVGHLFGLELPPLGAGSLRGRVLATAELIKFTALQAQLPGATVTGELEVALATPRMQLKGALHSDALDVAALRTALGAARGSRPSTTADWPAVPLGLVPPVDAQVALRVDRVVGWPVDVRDASVELSADAQGVRAPVRAQLAGIAIGGALRLDAAAPLPALSVQLDSSDQPLGPAARALLASDGIDATLGQLQLRIDGRAGTLGGWMRSAQATLTVRDLALQVRSSQTAAPLPVRIAHLQLDAPRGERLRGNASGFVSGQRVAMTVRGGTLAELLDTGAMPIALEASSAAGSIRIASRADLRAGTVLDVEARARRSGELAPWVDLAPASALPVALRGRMRLTDSHWHIEDTRVTVGRSTMIVNAIGSRTDRAAVTKARIAADLLDLPELASLRNPAAAEANGGGLARSAATWPRVHLDLGVTRVALPRGTLRDLHVLAQLRPGQLRAETVRNAQGTRHFDALLDVDLRNTPQGRLDLAARDIDLGQVLRDLQMTTSVEGRAGGLELSVQTRGNTWDEAVSNASVRARMREGRLTVRGGAQRDVADFDVRTATLEVAGDAPLRLRLDGAINATPVNIEAGSGTLAELVRNARQVPLTLAAQAAGTRLSLDGTLALPLGSAAELRLQMSGERLDRLGELARVELPTWGPWSITGPVRATPAGFLVRDLHVRVGDSALRGDATLDLSGARPRVTLRAVAPLLQLDDFPLPAQLSDPQAQPRQVGVLGAARDVAGRTDQLLAAQVLRTFDALVDVQADAVLAGERRLGGGALRLQLEAGRLSVDPAVLNLPGGNLRVSMTYDLKESDIDFAIAAEAQRFDYGVVVSRLGLGDDSQGLFSMRLNLAGTAPSLDSILRHANGTVDIAVWPNEMRSGMFRLWSVNVILTVLTLIDPQRPSRMNCIVGRFDFKDGLVSDDKLVIDTTALRVRGAGQIDLRSDTISAVFRPRAKGVALFRLQQPLRVSGTLTEQRFGIDARDTPGAIARLIFSPILWPIEQLTLGPLPRDGADVCTDPLRVTTP